ncbi:MAG: hypothetical protein GY788_22015 [bacterium]|nr:hypothetical protein [bacterium]
MNRANASPDTETTDSDTYVGADPVPIDAIRHVLFLLAAIVLWALSLSRADESALGDYGLISILPITSFVALAAVTIGFVAACRFDWRGPVLASYVLALSVMLHGMPTFAYDHLRFSWAWKHVGIVDYIQRFSDVDPEASALPVYHNWPGFFGINAWISDSGGIDSALSFAAWAPIVFNLLFIGALYLMFRAFTADHRLIWTALLIFELGSWVGQDYFAPQAMAFFLYLLVMAILLRWFSSDSHESADLEGDELPAGGLAAFTVSAVMVLSMIVIASSHQLTPIITVAAIGALVVFRQIRVIWPLYVMIGVTVAWFLGPARGFVLDNVTNIARELGGVQANLDNTIVDFGLISSAQRTISIISRLLSASIFGLAVLGFLHRRLHRQRSGWVILLAAIPLSMVFASSYGGEIIFRAYLFALPFAAFLAASLWFPTGEAGREMGSRLTLGLVLLVLTAGLLVANFGSDRRQVFDDSEVAAAEYVLTAASPGSLIIEGTRDYPRQQRSIEQFTYLTLDRLPSEALGRVLAEPAERLASWLSDTERYSGGYVILTGSQRASVSILGSSLVPTLDTIEDSLRSSNLFEVAFEADNTAVFRLVEQP